MRNMMSNLRPFTTRIGAERNCIAYLTSQNTPYGPSLHSSILAIRDFYMHQADLLPYLRAHDDVDKLYSDRDAWVQKAIWNIASSGRFSSDRTIAEYSRDILEVRVLPHRLRFCGPSFWRHL
jgi:hypothetical protein